MEFKEFEEKIMKRRANRKEIYEKKVSRLGEDYERQDAQDEEKLRLARNEDKENRLRRSTVEHEEYKRKETLKREKIEFDKSERGRFLKAKEDARLNIERDLAMGLTGKQMARKYLDEDARVRAMNKDAERDTDKMLGRTILNKTKTNLAELVKTPQSYFEKLRGRRRN